MSAEQDQALSDLLQALAGRTYRFITPTPATHASYVQRLPQPAAPDLRGIMGWSQPFSWDHDPDGDIVVLLEAAGALETDAQGIMRSLVRVSSLDDHLFLHSGFPTTQADAVFFGPDSYRYASFLRAELPRLNPRRRVVDIGAGTGVGATVAASLLPGARITMTDINPEALRFARINADFNGVKAEFIEASSLDALQGEIDCIIANPPYIADPAQRAYRDGGGLHGGEISLAWTKAAATRLTTGGAYLLYTGSAIVDGEDHLKHAVIDALDGFEVSYRELDPDVFGEELEQPAYAGVERIAIVGLVATKR